MRFFARSASETLRVRLVKGKKGRYRWSVYDGERCVMLAPVNKGHATRKAALAEWRSVERSLGADGLAVDG